MDSFQEYRNKINTTIKTVFDPFLGFAQLVESSATERFVEAINTIVNYKTIVEAPIIDIYKKENFKEITEKLNAKIKTNKINISYQLKGGINGFVIFHYKEEEKNIVENNAYTDLNVKENQDLIYEIVSITVSNYFAAIANMMNKKIQLHECKETDINSLMKCFPDDFELVSFTNQFYTEKKECFGSYTMLVEKNNFDRLLKKQNISRILMVDDITYSRLNTKNLIFSKFPDVVVDEAKDGLEGIEKHKKNKYDLILMDITMPNCDGIKAVKQIIEFDPHAKIIMFTSLTNNYTVIESIKSGAKDFISKQSGSERLYSALQKHLKDKWNNSNVKLNCWEYMNCKREGGGLKTDECGICPAFLAQKANGIHHGTNGGRCCWFISGTFCCEGKPYDDEEEKESNCKACDFYKYVREQEGKDFKPIFMLKKEIEQNNNDIDEDKD